MSARSHWELASDGGGDSEMRESFGACSIELGCEVGKDSPGKEGRDSRKGWSGGTGDEGAVNERPVNVARRDRAGGRECGRPDPLGSP